MADDIIASREAETPRLDTVTFYDPQSREADERVYVAKVEERRGRVGHYVAATAGDQPLSLDCSSFFSIPGYLPRCGEQKTSPEVSGDLETQTKYRVILSGAGGDEFLGGVPDPRSQLADLMAKCQIRPLFQELIAWSLVKKQPLVQLFLQSFIQLFPPSVRRLVDTRGKIEAWIDPKFARRWKLSTRRFALPERSHFWLPGVRESAVTIAEMSYYLARHQLLQDGEERRYPYLDRALVEFLSSIPGDQLLRPGQRRSLMRRALVNLVPAEVLFRKTKGYGTHTCLAFLVSNWAMFETIFGSPSWSSRMGYIDFERFREVLVAAKHGKTDHLARLLRGVSLELWLRDLARRGIIHEPTDVRCSSPSHTESKYVHPSNTPVRSVEHQS